MTTTIGQLPEEEKQELERRWKVGTSPSQLDAEFGLAYGATGRYASKQRWQKDAAIWGHDVEVGRLNSRISHLTRLYNQAIKEKIAVDRIVEATVDAIKAAEPIKPLTLVDHTNTQEQRAVALVSDVHVGEVVLAKETNYLGEYNSDLFKQRLHIWTDKVVELVALRRQQSNVPNLSIFMLGDIVSGDIHDELSNTNDIAIVDQVILAAHSMSSAILTLCQHFEEIDISGVVGNHGRMNKKPYYKGKQRLNWDYLIYQIMAMMLAKQTSVSFHIPDSFWTIRDVLGTRFLLIHGDGGPSGFAGIPYYGVERVYLRLRDLVGREINFDRVVMGHYHDPIDTERWHINGSFKGADEYSIGRLYKGSRPSQTLMYVHPNHGVIGNERIYLDNRGDMRVQIEEGLWPTIHQELTL